MPLEDEVAFKDAVKQVIASHGDAAPEDQVLVQLMIREPAVTGVIMTRALADGAPWYVINYDDESGKTDTLTGGSHVGKTVYVYREAGEKDFDSPRLAAFVALARRREEFRAALTRLTGACLDLSPSGTLAGALDAVAELHGRQAARPLVTSDAPERLETHTPLLAECRRYGTLPFSISHGTPSSPKARCARR